MSDRPRQASERGVARLVELYLQSETEVRARLKRQPRVHPQFRVGVQVALRWMREAMAARVGPEFLDPHSPDDPRPK